MTRTLQEISDFYFNRFGYKTGLPQLNTSTETKMIIVIPVHNENGITKILTSLNSCDLPHKPVEVILVINQSESAKEAIMRQNLQSVKDIESWIVCNQGSLIRCNILEAMNLPDKLAGVGLARKIGMDAALKAFASINYNGLIVCLDADCTVEANYLQELEINFCQDDFHAGNIYYQHPLQKNSLGIRKYELGLRYYVNALRFAGYPYSYHTIGSSMAVSARTYAKSGGMNKRKAGEDFYFLHKLIPLGGFKELNSTAVYPSSRVSERVPFGTGRAMLKWEQQINRGKDSELPMYCFRTFKDLKKFVSSLVALRECTSEDLFDNTVESLPHSVRKFLVSQNFYSVLNSCIGQSASEEAYLKRIYAWLDGFKVLKFVHYAREHYYPEVPVEACAKELLSSIGIDMEGSDEDLLTTYRTLDRSR